VHDVPGIERIRFATSHPRYFTGGSHRQHTLARSAGSEWHVPCLCHCWHQCPADLDDHSDVDHLMLNFKSLSLFVGRAEQSRRRFIGMMHDYATLKHVESCCN
jgi:hypothetical protein